MKKLIKKIFYAVAKRSTFVRSWLAFIFPSYVSITKDALYADFLGKYIQVLYPSESLNQKLFYNIGAGNQRSELDIWQYIDLKSDSYDSSGIDIFFNLESLEQIPLDSNHAEVVFNSFVIEHISVAATKNLCREAFRILKKGGVFHSKVHSFEYGRRLLSHNIISPRVPFFVRETREQIDDFLQKHRGQVHAFFDQKKRYVVQSIKKKEERLIFSSADAFLYHNASAAIDNLHNKVEGTFENMKSLDDKAFFDRLQTYIEPAKRLPHQHNADYFGKDDLLDFIKGLGFSEVYFTQTYQSISPVLWEEKLNPFHAGFSFSIEAIK